MVDSIIYIESLFIMPDTNYTQAQKKVLILRKDGLGDCIIFYPTLSAYRSFYADAKITLVFPKYFQDLSPLLDTLIDQVIWFDHAQFSRSFLYRRNFLLNLKRQGYDTAIYPTYTRESIGDSMIRLTRARERIGFDGDPKVQGITAKYKGDRMYTRLIRVPKEIQSEIQRDVYFAERVTGKAVNLHFPTFDPDTLPREHGLSLMQKHTLTNKRFAVIFPGAGAPYRIWPADRYSTIVDKLAAQGILSIICGSKNEHHLAKSIITGCTQPQAVIDLTGQTDLITLSQMLKHSVMYFGSDTGIMHLAVAVGTPTIAIVGSGGLYRYFPYGDEEKNFALFDHSSSEPTGHWDHERLMATGKPHPSITNISVHAAMQAIDQLIGFDTIQTTK